MAKSDSSSGDPLHHDAEWLRQKYVVEGLTQNEIGDLAGVTTGCISQWMRRLNIPTSHKSERHIDPSDRKKYTDPDWLHTQYVDKDRSQAEIANEVGVSQRHISRKLHELEITTRSGGLQIPSDAREKLSDESWLKNRYLHDELSIADIAAQVGVSATTVRDRLIESGVSLRPRATWAERIEKSCANCDTTFKVKPSFSRLRFCSQLCFRVHSGPTSIEKTGWEILDRIGVGYRIEENINQYWVDAFVPDLRLCVEFDGTYWHGHPQTKPWDEAQVATREKDQRKVADLREDGYSVIRIWGHDLRDSPERVEERLRELIEREQFSDSGEHLFGE